jgi:hypothetical protein
MQTSSLNLNLRHVSAINLENFTMNYPNIAHPMIKRSKHENLSSMLE